VTVGFSRWTHLNIHLEKLFSGSEWFCLNVISDEKARDLSKDSLWFCLLLAVQTTVL